MLWCEKALVITQVAYNSYLMELERGRRLRRNRQNLLKTQEQFVSAQEEDEREAVVSQDHSSGEARCTIAAKQPAVNVEAAKPNENSTPAATALPQPVLSTTADVRTTRSGQVIKVPGRFVHD